MDWKKIVGDFAPGIATTLAGPLAGKAVSFLAKEFLGDESAGESEVAAAIAAATPEQLIRLRELDNSFALEMARVDLEASRVSLENTQSARGLFGIDQGPQSILSYILVVGFFAVLLLLIVFFYIKGNNPFSSEANLLLGTMLGALGTYVGQVIKFWFGGAPDDEKNMDRIYHAIPGTMREEDRKNG